MLPAVWQLAIFKVTFLKHYNISIFIIGLDQLFGQVYQIVMRRTTTGNLRITLSMDKACKRGNMIRSKYSIFQMMCFKTFVIVIMCFVFRMLRMR